MQLGRSRSARLPVPTPLAKPFTPSSRAMTTGAANSATAPPTMPLAADLRPELSPALASFGFLRKTHRALDDQHRSDKKMPRTTVPVRASSTPTLAPSANESTIELG